MSNTGLRVAQLSDLHLFADDQSELLGLNTQHSLVYVMQLFFQQHQQHPYDLLLLTGDLSQDESDASYQRCLANFIEVECPIIALPGNHDDPARFNKQFKNTIISTADALQLGDWQFILAKTAQAGCVHGELSVAELQRIDGLLSEESRPTVVATHHHIAPLAPAWLHSVGTRNGEQLSALLKQYPQVKAVLSGHVHQASRKIIDGIPYYTTPSTCLQFASTGDRFQLDLQPPGYRDLWLFADGRLQTEVLRVTDYPLQPRQSATGY